MLVGYSSFWLSQNHLITKWLHNDIRTSGHFKVLEHWSEPIISDASALEMLEYIYEVIQDW